MRFFPRAIGLALTLAVILAACGRAAFPAAPLPETPTPRATPASPTATLRPEPGATPTGTATPAPAMTAAATVEPTLSPSPTPDPYTALTIDALSARPYGGGLLEIVDTLDQNERFARYLIKYPSDGLTIYGFMNVPNEGSRFPVAIVLHGYIDPVGYETVDYTRRYADALAEAGYFVIHPNFRNYPPSDDGPDPFRIGYAIDVLNLVAILREQSQDPLGTLRRADADDINLWGHSMGGGVALRVLTVNPAPYLRAAVLYGSMSGDEALNYGRIREWTGGRGGGFELGASPAALAAISPGNYLDRIEAAMAIHHSQDDDVVPVVWSEQLCAALDGLAAAEEVPSAPECHFYQGQPHTFRGDGDALFMERTIAFYDQH